MKKVILIALGVLLSAGLICTQITDVKELRLTVSLADCTVISEQMIREEFDQIEKLEIEIDARYSKKLLGEASMEGTVTYGGKTRRITAIHPTDRGWTLVLWQEGDPPTQCDYLSATPDFGEWNLIYREILWFGPAETPEALIGSLAKFGQLL